MSLQDSSPTEHDPFAINTSVTHPARLYNYLLGGTVNFEADRISAETWAAALPWVKTAAIENRRFLRRAVTFLVKEAGVRQFLDIGTGIPDVDNVHEVAQSIDPRARVVYVDNDPIVLAHARQLLVGSPGGATAYIHADLREPDAILGHPDLRTTIDLTEPVALLLIAVLHFLPDAADPYGRVATLTGALAAGSHLAVSHGTLDFLSPETKAKVAAVNARESERARDSATPRGRAAVARFFDGMELVPPGITATSEWCNDAPPGERPPVSDVGAYAAVAQIS